MMEEKDLPSPTTNSFDLLDELRGVLKDKGINFESDGESYNGNVSESEALKNSDVAVEVPEKNVVGNEPDKQIMLKRMSAVGVAIVPQPIFFKTSIKRDPGSKLQDQLVKELNSVLSNRDGIKRTPSVKETKDAHKIASYSKKQMPKPNSVRKLFDNNVLANLEKHFMNRTAHMQINKERPSVKELLTVTENSFDASRLSNNSGEQEKGIKENNLTENQPYTEEKSFSKLKQMWKENIKLDDDKVANSSRVTNSQKNISHVFSSHSGLPIDNDRDTRNSFSQVSSSQNNVSTDIKDTVFQYGLNNGVMYTASVKIVKKYQKQFTIISISGCPYIQNIDDGGSPTASGDGLYSGEENKTAAFIVNIGTRNGDLGVKVEGPNSIAKTTLEQGDGKFLVKYVPVEVGVFTLAVTWNGKDIPGSPFHPKIVDPNKVVVVGGWQQILDSKDKVSLVVGETKRIVFDVSEAGPGTLTSEVTGPTSSLHSTVETTGHGQVTLSFTPEQDGNHYIHLNWSKIALPKSPLLGYAVHTHQDNKVILTGRGLKEATVREEAEFHIDGTQAGPGSPEVTLTGVKAEIPVKIIPVAQGKYRCQYMPIIPGAYLLNITWNNRQLRGSPYKVNVIGAFYPNKVTVTGEGLTGGIAGRSLNVTIDTRKAGPGELTASCMGPNKAAYCELEDNRDGTFELRMKPQEVGRHVLQVKYGGEHVQGSPFIIKVSAPPDASKVRVTGPGVEHGILARFQSKFIVETKGAGAGQLTVRVRGPKGSFRVEMKRDSQRDRTILCQYYPTEVGDYHISVRWSGVDVPGSPFLVHIVDTMAELDELLRSSMSARQPTARSYEEWREKL